MCQHDRPVTCISAITSWQPWPIRRLVIVPPWGIPSGKADVWPNLSGSFRHFVKPIHPTRSRYRTKLRNWCYAYVNTFVHQIEILTACRLTNDHMLLLNKPMPISGLRNLLRLNCKLVIHPIRGVLAFIKYSAKMKENKGLGNHIPRMVLINPPGDPASLCNPWYLQTRALHIARNRPGVPSVPLPPYHNHTHEDSMCHFSS
ncbi:hypothetical protein BS47DRAFT_919921 [Hydnum rufescens UP504]|uniref:Uncharacterized protein n=1 Tax=Hydnum rufescens UP504 TaxID=1448309 RepID=A0A9P6DZZ0_9AGAM|nr:hypothetical protein BS47DRAFT_919921 [Hydnum rufescens UP504]